MAKGRLIVETARRAGVEEPGFFVVEYDPESDKPIVLRIEQARGIYDYEAHLDIPSWKRFIAWVEWNRRNTEVAEKKGL